MSQFENGRRIIKTLDSQHQTPGTREVECSNFQIFKFSNQLSMSDNKHGKILKI